MKKIIIAFNSTGKIQKLKKLMKKIYLENTNQIQDIEKFNLNKEIIPAQVDRIEIEIKKVLGGDTNITIPKDAITFLTSEPPHNLVDPATEDQNRYLVLPWNIQTAAGRQELKNLINKIPAATNSLKYTVFINTAASNADDTASIGDFNVSDISADDNVEELLNKIQELQTNLDQANNEIARQRNLVVQRDGQISNFNSQIGNLNNQLVQRQNQINSLNSQVSSLQNTNYSQNTQLAQFNSSRNLVYTEYATAPRYVYRLTNYTGRVTVGAGMRVVGGTINVGAMGNVTCTADVKFD